MTMFPKLSRLMIAASVAAVVATPPGFADDASKARSVVPREGIMLNVGQTRAIGYFMSKNKACDLTLHLAAGYRDDSKSATKPVRVNLEVAAGSRARVTTADGQALAFTCDAHATAMTILPLSQIAYVAPAK